jgi:hypothetical protein
LVLAAHLKNSGIEKHMGSAQEQREQKELKQPGWPNNRWSNSLLLAKKQEGETKVPPFLKQ